ncbi:hypothetical protein EVAR_19996_1 [Eumeta japonica]|uniref:Uncharacterized protein n=1 Tax=Eumeta variegata TaxID=151549 RepID=A0A4C1V9X8_EUMVA|nr:hypothetical protein EVAR_19996_1 [Eumeta japonica]
MIGKLDSESKTKYANDFVRESRIIESRLRQIGGCVQSVINNRITARPRDTSRGRRVAEGGAAPPNHDRTSRFNTSISSSADSAAEDQMETRVPARDESAPQRARETGMRIQGRMRQNPFAAPQQIERDFSATG